MRSSRTVPALLALAAFGLADPAAGQVIPAYLGVGYGTHSVGDWDASVIDDGSFASIAVEDSDTGVRAMGGFEIGRKVGIEFGYTNFGQVYARGNSDGSSFWSPGPVSATFSATGFDLTLLGRWKADERVSLHARVGVMFWEADLILRDSNVDFVGNQDGDDIFLGLGLEFVAWGPLSLRSDYVRYSFSDIEVDSLGISLIWHYGLDNSPR